MATFHENLVQSFTNFKNKYITPIQTALNNKQDKTDNTLSTTSKNVVGAINEVNTTLSNKQDKLTNPLTQSDVKNSLTSTSTTTPLSAYQGYIMSRDIPWYGTSSTVASTIAKTATTSDTKFALVTGAKVSIKFTYNNTASAPTLNVDSTGAKSIKAYGTTAPTIWWQAGDVVTFTYDGTNWIMGATEGQISQIRGDLTGTEKSCTLSSIVSTANVHIKQYGGLLTLYGFVTVSGALAGEPDTILTIDNYDGIPRQGIAFFGYHTGIASASPVRACMIDNAGNLKVAVLPEDTGDFLFFRVVY